jgi:chromosome segregation ATPase
MTGYVECVYDNESLSTNDKLLQRVKALEGELSMIGQNVNLQMAAKDELIMQLQRQIEVWKNKYDALAKLYSQLRGEHLDLLNKSKGFQLKANSAQEAIDKMERMERDVKSKNLELADMIRERDRARYDMDRLKSVRTASAVVDNVELITDLTIESPRGSRTNQA